MSTTTSTATSKPPAHLRNQASRNGQSYGATIASNAILPTTPAAVLYSPNGRPITPDQASQILTTRNKNWWHWSPTPLGYFWSPDSIGIDTYELMMRTDDTIYTGIEMLSLTAISKLGIYMHDKKSIQKFVRENIEGMESGWRMVLAEQMSAAWAGVAVGEKLFVPDGNRIRYNNIEGLWPRSIFFMIGTSDVETMPDTTPITPTDPTRTKPIKNQLIKVIQWPWTGYAAEIPIHKAAIYSYKGLFGNFWGWSRLKPCFKWWYLKDGVLRNWGRTLERYASPFKMANTRDPLQLQTVPVAGGGKYAGQTMTLQQLLLNLMRDMQDGTDVVFDNETTMQVFQLAHAVGQDFELFLEACDKRLFRALGMPIEMISHDRGGSRAKSQTHADVWSMVAEDELLALAAQVLRNIIRPLIILNFGPQSDYGKFETKPIQDKDAKIMAETVKDYVDTGFISPLRKADMDQVRANAGYEPISEDDNILIAAQPEPPMRTQVQVKEDKTPGSGASSSNKSGPGTSPVTAGRNDPRIQSQRQNFSEQPPTRKRKRSLQAGLLVDNDAPDSSGDPSGEFEEL